MFVKNDDKLISLEVGKLALIQKWVDQYHNRVADPSRLLINEDFSIDSRTSIFCLSSFSKIIPSYIKFRNIDGAFDIDDILNEDMDYCPLFIDGALHAPRANVSDDVLDKYISNTIINGSIFRKISGVPQINRKKTS
jgi:hypothetical protein